MVMTNTKKKNQVYTKCAIYEMVVDLIHELCTTQIEQNGQMHGH